MKQITCIVAARRRPLFGLAACETAPETSGVLDAGARAVAAAEADPNVTKYAPTELDRARKLLINAEGAAKEKGAKDTTAAHYAYLATQMARIAEQRAHEQVAIARIKAGETERQKILLSAREGEANQALAQARAAQSAGRAGAQRGAERAVAAGRRRRRSRSASRPSSRTCRPRRPRAASC